jgi:hypothetical protein
MDLHFFASLGFLRPIPDSMVPALPILQQDKWRGTSATQRWS